jgi:hypothetical protein
LKQAKSVRQKAMHTSEDLNGLNCTKKCYSTKKNKVRRGGGGGRRRQRKEKKKKNRKMCNNTECKGSEKGTEAKAREAMQKKKRKKKTTTTTSREGEHKNTTRVLAGDKNKGSYSLPRQ